MSPHGATDPSMVAVRAALLDALEALADHLDDVVVIGAQAVYLHAGGVDVAIAESTTDADVAIDPRDLSGTPLIEGAMRAAGFTPAPSGQPGSWMSPRGIEVDLMVPEALAGAGSRGARGARIPPHSRRATRRAVGLEAAVVDCTPMTVRALDPEDTRSEVVQVAGPAALMVAKLHKIGERAAEEPRRLVDKDAHDVYRLLRALETETLRTGFTGLLEHPLSGPVTRGALDYLDEHFARGSDRLGSTMAGRAEIGVGDPAQVAASVAALAEDLIEAMDWRNARKERP